MIKRILPILLLISPYIFILVLFISLSDQSNNLMSYIIWIYFGIIVVVFIPNMVYAFIMQKHVENSSVLLFWSMLLKLCNIPIYVSIFIIGSIFSMVPKGFIIVPFLMVFDYILLLPSSMYGVSGLVLARREGKITTAVMLINCMMHFIFCLDVISAIVMFSILRLKGRRYHLAG